MHGRLFIGLFTIVNSRHHALKYSIEIPPLKPTHSELARNDEITMKKYLSSKKYYIHFKCSNGRHRPRVRGNDI